MRKGSCAYVAALLEIKPVQVVEVCDVVLEVLQDVADMMPQELPKKLHLRRPIDYHIELALGFKPCSQVPCQMPPSKLVELRNKLTELLDAGLVKPLTARYGALVLL